MNIKIRSLFIVGTLEMLVPFTGFPSSWKFSFVFILGLIVCFLTFSIRQEFKNKGLFKQKTDAFSEHMPHQEISNGNTHDAHMN